MYVRNPPLLSLPSHQHHQITLVSTRAERRDWQEFRERFGTNTADFKIRWHSMFGRWPKPTELDDYLTQRKILRANLGRKSTMKTPKPTTKTSVVDISELSFDPDIGYQANAERAIHLLLRSLGQDPTREGLQDTPRRMAKMLMELCSREEFAFTTFDAKDQNGSSISEMIVQSPIYFASLCAHHCLPFVGTASLAYIPNNRIVGLSKLARTVAYCAKGLARHFCMEMRGVKAHDAWTITSCLRGVLLTESEARLEFMALTK